MRTCPHCLNTSVIEDGYCGNCRQCTMAPLDDAAHSTHNTMTPTPDQTAKAEAMAGIALGRILPANAIGLIGNFAFEECSKRMAAILLPLLSYEAECVTANKALETACQCAEHYKKERNEAQAEYERLRNELRELLELSRMQIAAAMTASIQNTEATVKDRIGPDNLYWTVAYDDVCKAVDREMKLRAERDELKKQLEVCEQLDATFWEALKPLNLKSINVMNPGQHVTDLIKERDVLRTREAALMAVARAAKEWDNMNGTEHSVTRTMNLLALHKALTALPAAGVDLNKP